MSDVSLQASLFVMKNIQTITSKENTVIRLTHAIVHTQRRAAKEGLFIVEGLRLAEMAAASDWRIRHALVTEHAMTGERVRVLIDTLVERSVPVALVTESLFSSVSQTDTPQGILLVMERRKTSLELLHTGVQTAESPLYIALDRVQDPGNVGTILRTSDAVGASGVILLRGCADVYSSKVVRATMGSLFHVPFALEVTAEELIHFAEHEGLAFLAAACNAGASTYFAADLRRSMLIVLGNEANGVSEELLRVAKHIYIPMRGAAESLNVATAATALLYEALRQRLYA